MALHVSSGTTPDITFAASQVAWHAVCPKMSHAGAVKCSICHLAGTADEGLIIRHDGIFDSMTWADADFVGTLEQEPSGNANAVKSRH